MRKRRINIGNDKDKYWEMKGYIMGKARKNNEWLNVNKVFGKSSIQVVWSVHDSVDLIIIKFMNRRLKKGRAERKFWILSCVI